MWNKLKDIFSPETYEEGITSNSAIAAILVRAAKTDNEYTESEKKLIDHLLANNLNISQEDARLLRLQGQELEMEINDNVQLTRIIKQDIPYEDRHQLIEQLWCRDIPSLKVCSINGEVVSFEPTTLIRSFIRPCT